MPRTLHDFLGKHRGETAWLFGKGPSLDLFDLATAGPLRCAINDVVKEIPGCVYAFANDAVLAWQHVYQPQHVLFTPQRTIDDGFDAYGQPGCEVIGYADGHDDNRLDWPAARLATEGLAIRPGTLGSALQVLAVMGVARVVLVGIDGGGRHASREWLTRLRNEHYRDYNRIRDAAIEAGPRLGLTLQFFHPTHNPDGTMKLLITRSTVVRGQADAIAGEVRDIPEREAKILLVEGAATAAPERIAAAANAPESAEATPAAETAVAHTAPKRRRRAAAN